MLTLSPKETHSLTRSVTLYFKQGGSEKVYHASLESKAGGFVVNFAYGLRGSTLCSGTKTTQPLEYENAVRVYEKLVKEKTSKGYTPGSDGTPYQNTSRESRSTGILPQLLNPITDAQIDGYLTDDRWWMQEKFDGQRVLIRKEGAQVTGINRNGLVIDLPNTIERAVRWLDTKTCLLDGEAIGDVYVAFDCLQEAAADLRNHPYRERYAFLTELVQSTDDHFHLRCAHAAVDKQAKQSLVSQLREQKKEGVVLKNSSAPYSPGRPNTGGAQLKLKFYATVSCIVLDTHGTKRSVKLELNTDGQRVGVGSVTIPPNHKIPTKGKVVEVRYLYAFSGGSLYQPTFLGHRDDIQPTACRIDQLKFKTCSSDETAD